MKKQPTPPFRVNSISQHHQLTSLPKPEHPLVSILTFEEVNCGTVPTDVPATFTMDFYSIALKRNCSCKVKYGQNSVDFNQGVLSFVAPHQVLTYQANSTLPPSGWLLLIHPDLLRKHPLAQRINDYGFFHYALHEALHLSEKEELIIEGVMQNIRREYQSNIDSFSQPILISHIEVLLNYADRFYNRQFITRKPVHSDLLIRLETVLTDYLNGDAIHETGLPTVQYIADQLNMSPNYLGYLLTQLTGQSTQQHIHNRLIERAKQLLTSSELSVGEIAYRLGFDYSQSFSKLFKNKTSVTPMAFRQSFN